MTLPALIDEVLFVRLNDMASAHVDANDLEGGWFLRGVTDALASEPYAPPSIAVYRLRYMIGYDSIVQARAKAEV